VTDINFYLHLYYALLSTKYFNDFGIGINKFFIFEASTINIQFSLHNNYLFNDKTSLSSFLKYISPNLSYLKAANYLDDLILAIKVKV